MSSPAIPSRCRECGARFNIDPEFWNTNGLAFPVRCPNCRARRKAAKAAQAADERLDHQFGRNYPGGGYGGAYRTTPIWPSDTTQFGVYNVRGPW